MTWRSLACKHVDDGASPIPCNSDAVSMHGENSEAKHADDRMNVLHEEPDARLEAPISNGMHGFANELIEKMLDAHEIASR